MKMTTGIYAALFALAAVGAQANQHSAGASDTVTPGDQQMDGMAGQDGMSGDGADKDWSGKKDRSGKKGHMGASMMPAMVVAMMDTNGDGSLSLEEVQAVHERMFKMADADGNGQVSPKEIRDFMMGGGMMGDGMNGGATDQKSN